MNSITSTYRKANSNIKKQINKAGKNLIRDKEVKRRMETNEQSNSFITIKDHKEHFDNHPTVRLNNHAKNEVGRISKLILDQINKKISQNLSQIRQRIHVGMDEMYVMDRKYHKFYTQLVKELTAFFFLC